MNSNPLSKKEFVIYVFNAITSALIDIGIFSIIVVLGLNPFIGHGISRIAGGLTSFVLNKILTFKKNVGRTKIEVRRFLLLYAASYLLSFSLLWFFSSLLGISVLYSKITADAVCFLFNFAVMKLYVYSDTRGLAERGINLIKGNQFD